MRSIRRFLKKSLAFTLALLIFVSSFGTTLTAFAAEDNKSTKLVYSRRARTGYDAPGYNTNGENVFPWNSSDYYWHNREYIEITNTAVNMKESASSTSTTVGYLLRGDQPQVLDSTTSGGTTWYKVEIFLEEARTNSDSGAVYPIGRYTGWINSSVGTYTKSCDVSYRYIYEESTNTPAYCIEFGASFGGASYTGDTMEDNPFWLSLDADAQTGIQLALLYGYPNFTYGVADCDAYAATQAIIWEFQMGYRTLNGGRNNDSIYNPSSTYTLAGIKGKQAEIAYNAIVSAISEHYTRPSFTKASSAAANLNLATLAFNSNTGVWTITLTDTNGVLDNYNIESVSSDKLSVTKSGNTLTVTATSADADNTQIKFTRNLPDAEQSLLVLNNSNNGQTCITGSPEDPVNAYITFNVEAVEGYVKINKTDEAGNPVPNATYGVYSDAACTDELTTITTDSTGSGTGTVKLSQNTIVYIKEKSLGSAQASVYKVDDTVYDITARVGQTVELGVTDEWKDAKFTLIKKDSTGNYISGITFTAYEDADCTKILKDINGNDVVLVTSGGTAESEYIDTGVTGTRVVYLKETAMDDEAAEKYQMDTDALYTVILNAGQTTAVNEGAAIINKWLPAKFDFTKVDNLENKLAGVVFRVYDDVACSTRTKDVNGNEIELTTDSNGYAVSPEIDITNTDGTRVVYLKEISLPSNLASTHNKSTTVYTVNLVTRKTTTLDNIVNTVKPGNFTLTKIDDTNNPLQGVQFTAYTDATCQTILKDVNGTNVVVTTDANGVATSANIEITESNLTRTIYLKETYLPQSATHTMSSTEKFTVVLNAGKTVAVNNGRPIVNYWKPAQFELTKVDSTSNLLEGIKFTAYTDSECTTPVTDINGNVVTVTTNGSGYAISGKIKVTQADGTRVIYIKETEMPADMCLVYAMNTTVYPVTLKAAEVVKVNNGLAIVNDWLPGSFSIQKKDNTDNNLAGIKFTAYSDEACTVPLKDVNGNAVVLTTDSSGKAFSTSIAVDEGVHTTSGQRTVWIKETYMPDSIEETHFMNTNVVEVTVSAGVTSFGAEIVNDWKPAKVSIVKGDDTGNKLAGVQFTAYDDAACSIVTKDVDGNPVVIVTDENGYAISENIDVASGVHSPDGERKIYLQETFMPAELAFTHVMNTTPIPVILSASKTTDAVSGSMFINKWKPGKFELTKFDDTGNKLAGATFTAYSDAACENVLTDINGEEIVITTNANGYAISTDIQILEANGKRTVYVKETAQSAQLSATHESNNKVFTVVVPAGETATIDEFDNDSVVGIINRWKPGRFYLNKEDSDGTVLKDVVFKAYTDSECTVPLKDVDGADVILTTDENGFAQSADIKIIDASGTRTVYLKETSIPYYDNRVIPLSEETYIAVVQAGRNVEASNGEPIVNTITERKAQFGLYKENENGDVLAGIEFTAYLDEDCTVVATDINDNEVILVTDENGYAQSEYIAYPATQDNQRLYLKETDVPADLQKLYKENNNKYTVDIVADVIAIANNDSAIINEWQDASISLHKIDSWYEKNVLGATFTVFSDAECQNAIATLTTDADGNASVKDIPVDNNGKRTVYVRETKVSDHQIYVINDTVFTVVLNAGQNTEVNNGEDIINDRVKHEVKFMKIDNKTGAPLAGYKVAIYDEILGEIAVLTTGADGYTEPIELPVAEYTYKEIEAPAGYILDDTAYSFTISKGGSVSGNIQLIADTFTVSTGTVESPATIYASDAPLVVTLNKYDDTQENTPVEGAEIKITQVSTDILNVDEVSATDLLANNTLTNPYTDTQYTDENGDVTFTRMPVGTYVYQETSAAPGYHLTDATYVFTVDANGNAITGTTSFTNTPVETVITKTDLCTSDPVVGAEVVIFDESGNEVWREVTGENGTITALALKPGKYTFKETVNPDGYQLNANSFEFVIGEDSMVESGVTEFTNAPTEAIISKKDATTAEGVPGAEITIYDKDGEVVRTGITGNDGTTTFQYLVPGEYTFKETVAPTGYIINETVFKFTIKADGTFEGDDTVTDQQNSVTITKIDVDDGTFLAGAKVEVYNSKGELYATLTTGEDGKAIMKKVPIGQYTYKEVEAPTGYARTQTVFDFAIDEHGVVTGTTTISNKKTQVTVTKYDLTTEEPLADAVIAIYDKDGNEVARGTSSKLDGSFTVYKLIPGDYTFKEISAPVGYAKNPGAYSFTLDEFGHVYGAISMVNKPTEVTIKKVDNKTELPLAGATVAIYDADNTEVAREVTDENGEITVYYLPVGTYTYKEIEAPEGYGRNTATFTFTIDEFGAVTGDNVFENSPTKVVITKTDLTNSKPVPGAEVVIYDNENNEVFRDITAEDGTITAFYLPVGTYTFEEKLAPSTYKLNPNTFEFTINEDGTIDGDKTFTDEPTEVTITKVDSVTNQPVEGATIAIYNKEGKEVYKGVTDKEGTITVNYLPHGEYTFKELAAPATYKLNPETYSFSIDDEGGLNGVLEIANTPTEVTITKTDIVDSAPVLGAVITIYDKDGKEVFVGSTDKEGKVTAFYLPHGDYTFKETYAPSKYKLNATTFNFTIKEDGSVVGTTGITDEPTEVTITKTDLTTAAPVPGATIVIYDKNGEEVFTDVTADDGTVTAFYLPHGTYTFEETIAPSTYQRNTNSFEFTINDDGSVEGVTDFTDEPTEVTITKIASDSDASLAGAGIIVYNEDNDVVFNSVDDGKTNENGEIVITYLPHGTYTYVESVAPVGYAKNPATFTFTIDADGIVSGQTEFKNEPTEVTITKADITSAQPIPGATITIYDADGEVVFEDVTADDGTITAFKLPVGTYTFKETVAPSEYQLNTNELTFTIDELGNITGDTLITNTPTEITITKTDAETNEPLANAEITIYDVSGSDVVTLTTGTDGTVTYQYLPHGQYTYKETKAPEGYVLSDAIYSFTIDETGTFVGDNELPNIKIYGNIEISKADAEDSELMLPNATFDVMNADGVVIATIVTDENGIATAEHIEYGEYTVVETIAPEGYNINAAAFPVSIVHDGDTVRVDVRDSVIKGRVEITKKNSVTKEPVANAEFQVIDKDGNVVETIVTDKDGIATTSLLRYGDYTLRESKAPVGYIAGDDVEFSITSEGATVKITYFENPIVKTGSVERNSTSIALFALAGIMALASAGCVAIYTTSKKKQSKAM